MNLTYVCRTDILRDTSRIPWVCFLFSKAPEENAHLQESEALESVTDTSG